MYSSSQKVNTVIFAGDKFNNVETKNSFIDSNKFQLNVPNDKLSLCAILSYYCSLVIFLSVVWFYGC